MNQESNSENSNGQTPDELALYNAIQFYEQVRVQASKRLSFAPRGDNGLPDASGAISSSSLSEMWDGIYQRQESVLRSLVEHSELPDSIHELSSPESSESRLAGTIYMALSTWMLADLTELMTGGELHTVGPSLIRMMQDVGGPPVTLLNTSPKKTLLTRSSPLTSTQERAKAELEASEPLNRLITKRGTVRKRTGGSKPSSLKLRKGKKRPSAKKKKRKSGKRYAGKRKG